MSWFPSCICSFIHLVFQGNVRGRLSFRLSRDLNSRVVPCQGLSGSSPRFAFFKYKGVVLCQSGFKLNNENKTDSLS